MFNYAKYNEEILGNKSIIISNKYADFGLDAYDKFSNRFKTYLYEDFDETQGVCEQEGVEYFYSQKSGTNDGKLVKGVKNLVHAVFRHKEPHGDVYAYISDWLSKHMTNGSYPAVPYIVEKLPETNLNLRSKLNIPNDALVFGYHGGNRSFNLKFVHNVIKDVVKKNKNLYFLFMNVDKFDKNERIIHLPGTFDLLQKSIFINTCDSMLHARDIGETFGLSIAEFSSKNKPVITYKNSPDKAHYDMLGDLGYYYANESELKSILLNYKDLVVDKNYDAYSEPYSPQRVMGIFDKVFLV